MQPEPPLPLQPYIGPPPVQQTTGVNPSFMQCIACGYDLSGTPRDGACSECGVPVAKTIEARLNRARRNEHANAALTVGVLSLLVFPPLGAFAIHYALKARDDHRLGNCPPKALRAAFIGMLLGCAGLLVTFIYVLIVFVM